MIDTGRKVHFPDPGENVATNSIAGRYDPEIIFRMLSPLLKDITVYVPTIILIKTATWSFKEDVR